MEYIYLLIAGSVVSTAHFYLVWHHRDDQRYSISEYAILARKSYILYLTAHVICEIFYIAYSYEFLFVEHNSHFPFYLNLVFALLDFVQAAVPSRGRTEKVHFAAAYISWCCYLLAGLIALFTLHVVEPYKTLALLLLAPTLGMFMYMHINRSKLYPYQLAMVPLFVLVMLFVTIGAR
jgi:hypothetical protein